MAWSYGIARIWLTALFACLMVPATLVLFWFADLLLTGGLGPVGTESVFLALLTGCLGLMMVLLAILLVRSAAIAARWRLELTASRLRGTVPEQWNGPNPYVSFRSLDLHLSEIAAVEVRDEVSKLFGMPTLVRSLSVRTQGGERFVVGRCTHEEVGGLAVDKIGSSVARAAGVQVSDRGVVDAPSFFQATLKGRAADWDGPAAPTPLSSAETSALGQRAGVIAAAIAIGTALITLLRACSPP